MTSSATKTKTSSTRKKTRSKAYVSERAATLRAESHQALRDKLSGINLLRNIERNYEEVEKIQQDVLSIDGPIAKQVDKRRKVAPISDAVPALSVKDQVDKCKVSLDCVKIKLDTNWKRLNKLLPDAKELDEGEAKKNSAIDFADAMQQAMQQAEAK